MDRWAATPDPNANELPLSDAPQQYRYVWDGKDVWGRLLNGGRRATVVLCYGYKDQWYGVTGGEVVGFGAFGTIDDTFESPSIRNTVQICEQRTDFVGIWDARGVGLGGWTFDVHHTYDPHVRTLHLGDGTTRVFKDRREIETVAGTGASSISGSDISALINPTELIAADETAVPYPLDVAAGPDGSIYVSSETPVIYKIDRNGNASIVAGNGAYCHFHNQDQCGVPGPVATQANLNRIEDIDLDAQGNLYLAETANHRILKVAPDGSISVFAGTGEAGDYGDGGPATQAALDHPYAVAVAPDGSVYIADRDNYRIRQVTTNGIIRNVAGTGEQRDSWNFVAWGEGGPADGYSFWSATDVAVGADGSLYIADGMHVLRVGTGGLIRRVAGTGDHTQYYGNSGDGGPATEAKFRNPLNIEVAPDDTLYISDHTNNRVRVVSPDGFIRALTGSGTPRYTGDGGPPELAELTTPAGVALGPDSHLYIADKNHRIRRVEHSFPGFFGQNDIDIASADGRRIYVFDSRGKHLETRSAWTNQLIYHFHYDADGLLSSFDRFTGSGAVTTTIHHDSDGRPTEIVSTYGDITTLQTNSDGFIEQVTNPEGESVFMSYDQQEDTLGLMTQFTDARGGVYTFGYDTQINDGRITADTDPAGGEKTFTRADFKSAIEGKVGFSVNMISSVDAQEHRFTTYGAILDKNRMTYITNSFPGGFEVKAEMQGLINQNVTYPDGTEIFVAWNGDPRWDMRSRFVRLMEIETPAQATNETSYRLETEINVELAEEDNPLSLLSLTRTTTINDERTYEFVFAPNEYALGIHGETVTSPMGRLLERRLDDQTRVLQQGKSGLYAYRYAYDDHGKLTEMARGSGTGPDPDLRLWTLDYYAASGAHPGRLHTVTNPLGQVTTYTDYDGAGRPLNVTLPGGRQIHYAYDANGNTTAVTPVAPTGPIHEMAYNPVDLFAGYTPPTLPSHPTEPYADITYEYNLARQLKKIFHTIDNVPEPEDAVEILYDWTGKVAGIKIYGTELYTYTYNDDEDPFTHDDTGQLETIEGPDDVILSYTWDGFLPKSTSWTVGGAPLGSVTRTYDDDYRVTGLTVNGAIIHFTYDDDSLLTAAGDLTVNRDNLADARFHGLVTSTTLTLPTTTADDITTQSAYNWFGEPDTHSASYGADPFYEVDYSHSDIPRDPLGRIVSKQETIALPAGGSSGSGGSGGSSGSGGAGGSTTETYDYTYGPEGRLKEVYVNGATSPTYAYNYDQNGNRTSYTGSDTTIPESEIEHDAQDRLLRYGSNTYTYTPDGRLESKTTTTPSGDQITTYDYDVLGNLLSVTLPATATSQSKRIDYIIDGQNRRIGRLVIDPTTNDILEERYFLYKDALNPIAELDAAGNILSRFIYGTKPNVPDYMIRGDIKYRVISDHLGSVRLVVHSDPTTGDLVIDQRIDYSPFGKVTMDSQPGFQPFGFAGGLYDPATGLVRFGARDYDGETGRWTIKDPILFAGGDTNLYGYVLGDPVNLCDSNGWYAPGPESRHRLLEKLGGPKFPRLPRPNTQEGWGGFGYAMWLVLSDLGMLCGYALTTVPATTPLGLTIMYMSAPGVVASAYESAKWMGNLFKGIHEQVMEN